MDSLFMIAAKYVLFAVIATLLNLFGQYASLSLYSGWGSLYLAIIVGTSSGLISKYIFDKKYIFYHQAENKTSEAKTFFFYVMTGGGTTIIFWTTEVLFDALWQVEIAKYVGAVVGLSIGYSIKYFLDKKYVFKQI
jgi:putative flippase GtrA